MGFTSWLDRTIETFAPGRAAKRRAYRAVCELQRRLLPPRREPTTDELRRMAARQKRNGDTSLRSGAYRGAETSRTNSHWNPTIGDADADSLDDLEEVRARSSDLTRCDGHAAGIITTEVSNVVGTGFRVEPTIDYGPLGISEDSAEKIGEEMKRAWRHWMPWADAAGHLDFRDMQQVVFQGILERGDIFLLRRYKADGRRPYGFCWQVIEADRVDTPNGPDGAKAVAEDGNETGNSISAGVETNADGEPVAYYILKEHPGSDSYSWTWLHAEEKDYERIPAYDEQGRPNVIHLYYQKRPGQTRGIPFFAPVLLYFQNLADYMEAELVAARLAACFGLIFNKNTNAMDSEVRPLGESEDDSEGRRIEEIQPGMMMDVFDTDVHQVKSERPGAQFDPFVARILRMMCAGVGLPYELVAKDFSQSNYSNMRAALLEARRVFKMQQSYLARRLCQPSYELVMEEAFIKRQWGKNVKRFYGRERDWLWCKWTPNGWEWVDPPREVKAEIDAIKNDLVAQDDAVSARGGNLDEVLRANATARNKRRELGLLDYAEEARVDEMLHKTNVDVSKKAQREKYHREEPEGDEDSTIPEPPPPPAAPPGSKDDSGGDADG
jgi:lambda family phage portal protein